MHSPKTITLGDRDFRLPSAPGYCFGSAEKARSYATNMSLSAAGIHETDTRISIREVIKAIRTAENAVCELTDSALSCGPWDEYFGTSFDYRDVEKWPSSHDYPFLSVYVGFGSNEGIHLCVDLIDIDRKRTSILTGKTCRCDFDAWAACHASAARIGWMLVHGGR